MEPWRKKAKSGDKVKFECKTYNRVKWTFRKGHLPINSKVSGRMNEILTLSAVQPFNAGTYECTMLDRDKKFSSEGTLELNGETIWR